MHSVKFSTNLPISVYITKAFCNSSQLLFLVQKSDKDNHLKLVKMLFDICAFFFFFTKAPLSEVNP